MAYGQVNYDQKGYLFKQCYAEAPSLMKQMLSTW